MDTTAERFDGYAVHLCGQRRPADVRAWCDDCSQLCHSASPCKGCELAVLRAELGRIDDLAFEIMAGEGESKRQAQDRLTDLLATRMDRQLHEALSPQPQPEPNYPCDGCGGSGERINRLEGYSEPCWCVR
jgi:hypothetical protein